MDIALVRIYDVFHFEIMLQRGIDNCYKGIVVEPINAAKRVNLYI